MDREGRETARKTRKGSVDFRVSFAGFVARIFAAGHYTMLSDKPAACKRKLDVVGVPDESAESVRNRDRTNFLLGY